MQTQSLPSEDVKEIPPEAKASLSFSRFAPELRSGPNCGFSIL